MRKMAIHTTIAIADNVFPSFPTRFARGVSSSSCWTMVAILPISVCIPICSTTPIPFPESTLESMYIFSFSFFVTASDSPVSWDSSQLMWWVSIKAKSAGTLQPSSKMTMSPIVRSFASISSVLPSLLTMACFVINPLRLSIAFCDRYSWINPMIAFNRTASIITPASMMSPIANDATAAMIRSPIRMSMNWDRNNIINGVGFFSAISFKPCSFCLF